MKVSNLLKSLAVLGLVFALFLTGVFVYLKTQKDDLSLAPNGTKGPLEGVVEKEEWVDGLPVGLFKISDAKETDSAFSSNVGAGYSQKSARYISTKDFNKTKQFFLDYFAKNSWTKVTESSADNQTYFSFSYKKEQTDILVTINNKSDGSVLVNMNIRTKI